MSTLWLTLAIKLLQILRWYIRQMPPEDKEEFKKLLEAWKKQIEEMEMPEPPSCDGP